MRRAAACAVILGLWTLVAQAAPGKKAGPFERAARLAGYGLAHSLFSISDDGELRAGTLIPLAFSEGADGKRKLTRFLKDERDLAQGVAMGSAYLEQNPDGAQRTVLVFDGMMSREHRHDALIAIVYEYGPPLRALEIIVPFQPSWGKRGPIVGKPRFQRSRAVDEPAELLSRRFSDGVNEHPKGAELWARFYHDRL